MYRNYFQSTLIKSQPHEKDKGTFVYLNRKNKLTISTNESSSRDEKIASEMKSIIEKHKPISEGMVFDEKSIETSDGISLSEEQIKAINDVIKAPIAVITGGPGSGKTTMVQGLVSALKILEADARLCAPTGRAAKRISETPGLSELDFHHTYVPCKGARREKSLNSMS